MKHRNLLALAAAWLVLAAAPSQFAQTPATAAQQTGSVSGRVQNAVTGQYLNNARISVKGTSLLAFTDQSGTYRLVDVPAGSIVLVVFYTDLDVQEITMDVPAGGRIERDVGLTSVARYGQDGDVVELDPFVVTGTRITDAEAIAIHEQRYASNIKNVVSSEAMGDLVGSSAGDFLKFVPGLAAEYDNAEVQGISMRGLGADMTTAVIDGSPIVTASHGGPGRAVNMIPQSINNISRIEVSKVPLPSSPADSLAGSVNLVTKSAFERSGAQLRYGVNLTGNVNHISLKRTPHSYRDDKTHKVVPGFDFDYTLPIGDNFGVVLTAMTSNTFNSQNISNRVWTTSATGTDASITNPYFRQFDVRSQPRHRGRSFYGFKADWRVAPNSVLSVGGRVTRTVSARTGTTIMTFNAGTNGNPTPATGVRLSYAPDFTIGATGRGAVTMNGARQQGTNNSHSGDLSYRFDDGRWRVEASLNYTESRARLNGPHRDAPFFNSMTAVMVSPVRVSFFEIGSDRPKTIEVFNNANEAVDFYDISNFRMNTAVRDVRDNLAKSEFGRVDIRRQVDLFSFPTAIQLGAAHRGQSRDSQRINETWTFAGANHRPEPYLYQVYVNQKAHMGFRDFPGVSVLRASQAFSQDPSLLSMTVAQERNAEIARINNSQYAEETVNSFYAHGEARLLDNRLNLLAGVRLERTSVEGRGVLFEPNAVFVRNPDGSFARNEQGNRIRRPEAGAAGSMDEVRLTRTERGAFAERSYQGYYPSVHLTYDIRQDLLMRVAFAKTYGRPNFEHLIPNTSIEEFDLGEGVDDPDLVTGNISVRNTGLKPWSADNYDLSIEYYTAGGGLVSVGGFIKEIRDFFGTQVRVATPADLEEVGLDPRYSGWNLTSQFNSGDARVSGVEVNTRHSLRELGGWWRHFTVFANATQLKLEGNPHASFQSFIPRTANWGFSFNWNRLTVMPKWNYRGLNKLTAQPAFGPDAFVYIKSRTILDLNLAYQLSPQLSLTASVSNVFNDHLTRTVRGSDAPRYMGRTLNGEYGPAFSVGLKGRF